jgi:hypothetical protein
MNGFCVAASGGVGGDGGDADGRQRLDGAGAAHGRRERRLLLLASAAVTQSQARTGRGIQGGRRRPQAVRPAGGPPPKGP